MHNSDSQLIEYGRYMARLIASALSGAAPDKPFKGIDWERLYKLALFHNVAVIICPVVLSLDVPDNVKKLFIDNRNRMMAREARQELEARRVFTALMNAGIPFIRMKGSVLKNYYPQPYMRTHSDVDICMSEDDRKRAKQLMLQLGYDFDSAIDYHDEYSKDNFFIYELHSSVMSPRSPLYSLFDDPFSKVKPCGDSLGYEFNDEYFYLSLIIHLYKHFVSEGCGIRLLCDLYVFENTHPNLDRSKVLTLLRPYGLAEFSEHIHTLCTGLFSGSELSDRYLHIASFIFRSGEYGNSELKRISRISSDKSANLRRSDKIKYFLHNWFPGVNVLKARYPILKKAPVLLPVCWVRRVFYTLFFKPRALKEQHDEIKKLNSSEVKEAKLIRKLAGIK